MGFSISNDLGIVFIWLYVGGPVIALWAFVAYRQWKAKRRAENKIRVV